LQNFDCRLLIADFRVCDAFVLKSWIKRYLKFHGMKRHPQEMGEAEVEAYLSNLATKGKVAASTQRQALNAIVFLYREVPSCSDEIGFLFQESSLPSFQHSKP